MEINFISPIAHHNLKIAHAYGVENELQAKNHRPASNLEQGWVCHTSGMVV